MNGNHRNIIQYMSQLMFFTGGVGCMSAGSGIHLLYDSSSMLPEKVPPKKFGSIAAAGSILGAKCFPYRVSIEQYLLRFRNLAPLGFKVLVFLASRLWTSAMVGLLREDPELGSTS